MSAKGRFLKAGLIGAAVLVVYGAAAIRWMELRSERSRLENEISSLKSENKKLYEEARRLREDPAYAEAVARRELGFVRPGETKIKIAPRQGTASASTED